MIQFKDYVDALGLNLLATMLIDPGKPLLQARCEGLHGWTSAIDDSIEYNCVGGLVIAIELPNLQLKNAAPFCLFHKAWLKKKT